MNKNNLFHKIYTSIFFLFWFGFLIFAAYICLRDENYGMLLYSGLFWIAGIIFAKNKFFPNKTKKSKFSIPVFGVILLIISWITLIVAGIALLIQGILEKEFGLFFMGGFFFFGAFTFVLGVLTIKGYFDKSKIDILGLYVGVFFVLCGSGFIAIIFQQGFSFLFIIPALMVLAGTAQIVKCLKKVIVMKELEKVLIEQISNMEVNDMQDCTVVMQQIYLDRTEIDNSKWIEMISEALKSAKRFEIHCWNEETDWIKLALNYGTLKDSTWKYGKIIEGDVTTEFITMILDMPKPTDVEIYNKMTPFFNVFLDDTKFQSSHYGTEIYIEEE